MNKLILLRFVNTVLLVSFAVQAATGIIFVFHIKAPNMEMIGEVHEYNGLLLTALVIIHIILNWSWVRTNFLKFILRKKL